MKTSINGVIYQIPMHNMIIRKVRSKSNMLIKFYAHIHFGINLH